MLHGYPCRERREVQIIRGKAVDPLVALAGSHYCIATITAYVYPWQDIDRTGYLYPRAGVSVPPVVTASWRPFGRRRR